MTIITSLALFQALLATAATYSKWHSYLAKATDTHGNIAISVETILGLLSLFNHPLAEERTLNENEKK